MKHVFLPLIAALLTLPAHAQTPPAGAVKGPMVITVPAPADGSSPPREIRIVTATGEGGDERVVTRRIIRNAMGPQGAVLTEDVAGMAPGGPRPPGMGQMMMMMRKPALGLELATLSPRLGSYFGAKSGVLVVHTDNASLKIEDGDIITAIDGRQPTTAEQARRILGSYAGGEKIGLKLVRDRKPLSVDVVMPEPPKMLEINVEHSGPHGNVAPAPKAP
jgi:hypothetical protein